MTPSSPSPDSGLLTLDPTGWPSYLRVPESRDFPDDGEYYQRSCCACSETFIGGKHRYICRVCETRDSDEAKNRAEWLTARGAPIDWVILTIQEVRTMGAELADLTLQLRKERALRRQLADGCRVAEAFGGTKYARAHWVEDMNAVVKESDELDAAIEARRKEAAL